MFLDLFNEIYEPDKSQYLQLQYPFVDIYGNRRKIDFALETADTKVTIEIDGETYHNPINISDNKYYDDLLKQNSLVYKNWKIYRWVYKQLRDQPEMVKDQLVHFLGEIPMFRLIEDYLPKQKGKIIELKDYQQEAIDNLERMREEKESIALLYHATGARVIIVTGCINALVSRVSETFIKNLHLIFL